MIVAQGPTMFAAPARRPLFYPPDRNLARAPRIIPAQQVRIEGKRIRRFRRFSQIFSPELATAFQPRRTRRARRTARRIPTDKWQLTTDYCFSTPDGRRWMQIESSIINGNVPCLTPQSCHCEERSDVATSIHNQAPRCPRIEYDVRNSWNFLAFPASRRHNA